NREEGTLHTRRGDVTVRLDNRSSGGFGVFLPEGSNSHVNNDEEIAFSLASGSSLVRVAHQSKTPEGVVIGLEFLRELPSHMSKNYVQRRGKGGGPWGIIPLCALAGCLLLTAVNFTWSRSLVGASVASLVGL